MTEIISNTWVQGKATANLCKLLRQWGWRWRLLKRPVVDQVVHDCKKAMEWVQAIQNVFAAKVELPSALQMDDEELQEAICSNFESLVISQYNEDERIPFGTLFSN
ncbi:hypothetical protein GJAV_G00099450 [Gymnothorax javanicus]|nr:hypothetical protein GJAV_G00099450 [Gymnothorax javanicus]